MNTKAMQAQVDYFASYLQDGRNASPHTVRSYTTDLNQFISWLEVGQLSAGQGWSSVTYLMIRRYLGHLGGEDYNRRSVVRKLASLKAFYKWMEREGGVSHNPAAQVLSPKTSKPLPDVLDIDEIELLLNAPNEKNAVRFARPRVARNFIRDGNARRRSRRAFLAGCGLARW